MDSLDDMFLVLKRSNNKYYLPTKALHEVEVEGSIVSPYVFIRVKEHDIANGILAIKIEGGHANEGFFQVSVLENWKKIEGFEIKKIVFALEEPKEPKQKFVRRLRYPAHTPVVNAVKPEPTPIAFTYRDCVNEEFDLLAKDITIEDGKVTFKKYMHKLNRDVLYDVKNEFLKKEFDPIKHYFFKMLDLKKIKVCVTLEVEDGRIINQMAVCEKLAEIDAAMIETVVDELVKDVILESDGEIYALEEKASDMPGLQGDNKEEQLQALLNKLFVQEKTKHYSHLSYLSSKHLHSRMKLMLTGSPLSYMFLLQGASNFFFIWEPYRSDEATYIWKLKAFDELLVKEEIVKILEEVKWLKKGNKAGFIKGIDPWHMKIIHDYQGPGNGFKKWLGQLKKHLGLPEDPDKSESEKRV